jgi:glycosyltransferase involved in cell wall biosynthesis
MSNLRTTVVIAHHNYEQYLQQAIFSALTQTIVPDKIIVIDDNSNNKEAVAKTVASFNSEIVQCGMLDQTVGPSTARNIAIDMSLDETDIYLILDADDCMYPHKVEEMLKEFSISDAIGVVYGDYDIHDIHKRTTIRQYKEPFSVLRLQRECIIHSGAGIRKQALLTVKDQFGYYDSTMRTCEDFDLWLRISDHYMISHIPKSLTFVRNHNNNSTMTVNNEIWQQNWNRIAQKRHEKQNR